MKSKLKYVLPIVGVAAVIGLGIGASPRAGTSHNDIIFGENGPIKLVSPDGVVVLTNASQTVTSDDYIHPGGGSEVIKRYALFVLDLNDGFSPNEGGTSWLGVELKASTNNFGMALSSTPSSDQKFPCFWSCTEISGSDTWIDPELSGMDECYAYVVWHDAVGTEYDNRGWVRIRGSILSYLDDTSPELIKFPRKIAVLVCPDLLKNTDGGWLRSDNENIVWSYMRTDATGYEKNENNKAIWTPCEPVCWFKSIPKWANHGVNAGE